MLADPAFCDMVHSIGVASLCADNSQIWHLTKIYWYTVEFGVVQEGDEMKAFGAGVAQSLLCLLVVHIFAFVTFLVCKIEGFRINVCA